VWDQEKINKQIWVAGQKKHHLDLWSRQINHPMDIPYVALPLAACRINVEFILIAEGIR